ncbi:MAG: metal-dependent hydrolase [Acidobacteria bacterium]|nr:metal-dependent hydrolase [Acidobacteriota bacterium]
MPFPVSHTITGLVFASFSPRFLEKNRYLEIALVALLANLPDFDFALVWLTGNLLWHRNFSHSILFALFIGALTCLLYDRKWSFGRWLVLSLVVFSHTLLDFFTSNSQIVKGVMVFWPFSQERFTADFIFYPLHNWRIFNGLELLFKMSVMGLVELLIYSPIFLLLMLLRHFLKNIFLKSSD